MDKAAPDRSGANTSAGGAGAVEFIFRDNGGITFSDSHDRDVGTAGPAVDPVVLKWRSETRGTALEAARAGKTYEAERLYKQLIHENPADTDSMGELGLTYIANDQIDDAYYLESRLIRIDAGACNLLAASVAAAFRGEMYEGQKQYCDAYIRRCTPVADQASSIPKGNSLTDLQISSCLALALSANGRGDVARTCFLTVIRLDPHNFEANFILGLDDFAAGNYAEAAKVFQAASDGADNEHNRYDAWAHAYQAKRMLEIQRRNKAKGGAG